MSINYNPHIIEDIPSIARVGNENLRSPAYIRGDCLYTMDTDEYWIYDGTTLVKAVKDTNFSDYDHYVLKYKLYGDSNYTIVEYNNFEALKTGLRTKTNVTDVVILYGSLIAPSVTARIIAPTENNPPLLALSKYEDEVYQWEIVGKITPKTVYKYYDNTNENIRNVQLEELFFNNAVLTNFIFDGNNVLQQTKPQIKIDIIETSTPQDPSKGYQAGETINVNIRIINTSSNFWFSPSGIGFYFDMTGDGWTIPDFYPGQSNVFETYYDVTTEDINNSNGYVNLIESFGYQCEGNIMENLKGDIEEPVFIINSPNIKLATPKKYWDVTYTTSTGVTTTTRYYEYNEIKDFFKNSSLVIKQVKIEEGSE